jgi:hypothetical protein
MDQQPENFWPSDLPDPTDPPPVAILKEQAELLAERTGGEIKGVVHMSIDNERAYHFLSLMVDALGDYKYVILCISYPVLRRSGEVYPLAAESLIGGLTATPVDDQSFRIWLRGELSSERVRSVLGTLKGYIRERQSVRIG